MYKYKCTECGQEYDELPQYCDCGNDAFDVVEQAAPAQQSFDTPYHDTLPERTFKRIDIPSLTIFVLCIIFAFIILFFAGNPSKDSVKEKQEKAKIAKQAKEDAKKQLANIPSIDEIWIENPAKKTAAPKASQQEQPQPQKTAQIQVPDFFKTMTNSFSQPQQQTKKPAAQSYSQPKKSTPARSNTQKTTQKKVTQTATKTKPVQSSASKTVFNPSQQPSKTTTAKKQTQKTTKSTAASKPKVNPAAQKQALFNYKIALRNKIASNINFAAIVGDGDCVVSFKISQSGQLTNRTFAKQSTNVSLNDAVYAGIMQTPAYNPPPSGYKNETLKLSVKMYGGNFEVDLN